MIANRFIQIQRQLLLEYFFDHRSRLERQSQRFTKPISKRCFSQFLSNTIDSIRRLPVKRREAARNLLELIAVERNERWCATLVAIVVVFQVCEWWGEAIAIADEPERVAVALFFALGVLFRWSGDDRGAEAGQGAQAR